MMRAMRYLNTSLINSEGYNWHRLTSGSSRSLRSLGRAKAGPLTKRWYDSHCQVKRTDPCLTF